MYGDFVGGGSVYVPYSILSGAGIRIHPYLSNPLLSRLNINHVHTFVSRLLEQSRDSLSTSTAISSTGIYSTHHPPRTPRTLPKTPPPKPSNRIRPRHLLPLIQTPHPIPLPNLTQRGRIPPPSRLLIGRTLAARGHNHDLGAVFPGGRVRIGAAVAGAAAPALLEAGADGAEEGEEGGQAGADDAEFGFETDPDGHVDDGPWCGRARG